MEILKRGEAAGQGLTRYYTGRPCINGHDSPRYVSTGHCMACQKAAQRAYQSHVMGRSIKVIIKVPRELAYDDEDKLYQGVYQFGLKLAAELAAARPMDIRTGKLRDPELQAMLADGGRAALRQEQELHPGGFRGPRVRNPDKAYLSVQTVTYPEPAPPPPPPAAPQRAVSPPMPPMPPVATPRPPEPVYVDDIEPTADELLAEFERMSR